MLRYRCGIFRLYRETALRRSREFGRVSTVFASTISGEFVSSGEIVRWGLRMSKSSIITRSLAMKIIAIHPGEHLAEELKALHMSAAELARKLDVPTNRITQILNGTRSITGDTALRLGHFFGMNAQFWLNLQSVYDLRSAQQKAGKSIQTLPTLKRADPVHA